MKNFIRIPAPARCLTILFGLFLSACGDNSDKQKEPSQAVDSNYKNTVFITFESGPNEGRHQYTLGDLEGGKIEVKYNKNSDVTFLELRGLVSTDGRLRVDELRRFHKGVLAKGPNQASTWRGETSSENKQCGVLNLRDRSNTQTYENGFGKYKKCEPTSIDSVSEWVSSTDSIFRMRVTKGNFRDRVAFGMSMDNAPFERFETNIRVEFDLLETMVPF